MLAVVSHDAGGAEILSSHVRQQGIEAEFVLDGPAQRVFARKLGVVASGRLDEVLRRAGSVLTGTSWQSDLEIDAIRLARTLGKRSVSFIDHWINYGERFTRRGNTHLPDEIWVGDAIAAEIAKRYFPATPVRVVENPYFADIRAELSKLPRRIKVAGGGASVLYVCEPVREHALRQFGDERHFGYVEEEALRFFLEHIDRVTGRVERVTIRPHPSEAADKYSWAAAEFALPLARGGQRPLVEEIGGADVVVGCESMAMVVGLLAGRRVVSSIPPGGRPCGLPHPAIEHLQTLIG
jgi:hypothetical protein